jgi:hypothetical protein
MNLETSIALLCWIDAVNHAVMCNHRRLNAHTFTREDEAAMENLDEKHQRVHTAIMNCPTTKVQNEDGKDGG